MTPEEQEQIASLQEQLATAIKTGNQSDERSALVNLGIIHQELAQFQQAIEFYQQSLAISPKISDTWIQAATQMNLANCYNYLNQRSEAIEAFGQAYRLFHTIENEQYYSQAWTNLNQFAENYLVENQSLEAIKLYQLQIKILQEFDDKRLIGWVLQNLGKVQYNQADYQSAIASFQQMLEIAKNMTDSAMESSAVAWLGCAYWQDGQLELALECFTQRLTLAKNLNDKNAQRETLGWLISVSQKAGQHNLIADYYTEQLQVVRELGDKASERSTLYDLGTLHFNQQQYQQALSYFHSVLVLAEKLEQPINRANAHYMLAENYRNLEQHKEAIEQYHQAVEVYIEQNTGKEWAAKALDYLCTLYRNLSDYSKAIEQQEKRLGLLRELGDRYSERDALYSLGCYLHNDIQNYSKALEYFTTALTLATELEQQGSVAANHYMLGSSYRNLGQINEAIFHYQKAGEIYCELNVKDWAAKAVENLGNLYYSQSNYQKASESHTQMLVLAREIADSVKENLALAWLGCDFREAGELEEALNYFKQRLVLAKTLSDDNAQRETLNWLSTLYQKLIQKTPTVDYYTEQLEVIRELGDKASERSTIYDLGMLHFNQQQYQQAIACFQSCLTLAQELEQPINRANAHYILGQNYRNLGQQTEAIEHYQQAVELYIEQNNGKEWAAKALDYVSSLYQDADDYINAIAQQEKRLELLRQMGDRDSERDTLYRLGCYLHNDIQDYLKAIEYFTTTLTLATELEQKGSMADAHYMLGSSYRSLGQTNEAIFHYQKAGEIYFEINVKDWAVKAVENLGNLYYSQGNYKKAIESHTQMLALAREIADSVKENLALAWLDCDFREAAINLYYQALALYNVGSYKEAITYFDQALELNCNDPDFWYYRGVCYWNLGSSEEPLISHGDAAHLLIYLPKDKAGYFEKALASYNHVLDINSNHFNALVNKANMLKALCRFEEALVAHDQLLELYANSYEAWCSRGLVLYILGCTEEALTSYDRAIAINPDFELAWYNRGNLFLNRLSHRSDYFQEAVKSYESTLRLNPSNYRAWHGYGFALNGLAQYEEAIRAHNRTLNLTHNQYYPAWVDKGKAVLNSQGYKEAIQVWDDGLQQLHRDTPFYKENCGELHNAKGKAYYEEGRWQLDPWLYWNEAKKSFGEALKFLTAEAFPEKHLEVLLLSIKVCCGLGEAESSEELLRNATDLLDRLVWGIPSGVQKILLKRKFAGFNQLRVDELARSGRQIEALELAEERKNICLSWLRQGWSDTVPSPKYEEIQKLVNPHTAAIYWHISPAAITTFILKYNQPPITLILRYDQPSFRFSDEATPDSSTYAAAARQLMYLENWLTAWKQDYQSQDKELWRQEMPKRFGELAIYLDIPEILFHLSDIDHLILLPHRDLHLLPLHTLFSEKFTITYLPSAQIGLQLQSHSNSLETLPMASLLNIENPTNDTNLKFATVESAAISLLYPISNHLKGNEATKEQVITALQADVAQGIFHFTGHGCHNFNKPLESALLLAEQKQLTLQDIFQIDFSRCHLVCLSACETGITGNKDLIDEFVGLVSSFLATGTTYVVSSLWRVEDISTTLMMIYFYQALKTGIPPASALKQAQNSLRTLTYSQLIQFYQDLATQFADKDLIIQNFLKKQANQLKKDFAMIDPSQPIYDNPYYWAGFTITGKV